MKVIALLILSLTVVVCEQQTLITPHFVTFFGLKVNNPTGSRNSLRPAAHVNRLAPLAGHRVRGDGDNEGYKLRPTILKHGPGLQNSLRPIFDPACFEAASSHHGLQPTPDPNMNLPEPTPVEPPVWGPVSETCPPRELTLQNSNSVWKDDPEW